MKNAAVKPCMTNTTEQQENLHTSKQGQSEFQKIKLNGKALIGELIVLTQMAKYEIETITGATQTNDT